MAKGLPRLKKLGWYKSARLPRETPSAPPPPKNVPDPGLPKLTARGSSWETWLDLWLRKRDPEWRYQNDGLPILRGGSIPDWAHPSARIALFLDGPVHRIRYKQPHDVMQRAAIVAAGWRVVAWEISDLNYLKRNIVRLYRRDIGL